MGPKEDEKAAIIQKKKQKIIEVKKQLLEEKQKCEQLEHKIQLLAHNSTNQYVKATSTSQDEDKFLEEAEFLRNENEALKNLNYKKETQIRDMKTQIYELENAMAII